MPPATATPSCSQRGEVFAERGVDVPLEEIARRAGVGIATLYRRFPTREALVAAAFEPKLKAYAAAAAAAVGEADPWLGFSGYVRTVCAMQADDAGFADVVALTFPATRELDRQLRTATAGLKGVIERAKAAGSLREDFVMEDLVLVLLANAGVVNATKSARAAGVGAIRGVRARRVPGAGGVALAGAGQRCSSECCRPPPGPAPLIVNRCCAARWRCPLIVSWMPRATSSSLLSPARQRRSISICSRCSGSR